MNFLNTKWEGIVNECNCKAVVDKFFVKQYFLNLEFLTKHKECFQVSMQYAEVNSNNKTKHKEYIILRIDSENNISGQDINGIFRGKVYKLENRTFMNIEYNCLEKFSEEKFFKMYCGEIELN